MANFFTSFLFLTLAPLVLGAASPISIKSSVVLGNQTSSNDAGTYRDGGWEGNIGSTYWRIFADTQHCSPTDAAVECSGLTFRENTIALSTSDPQVVKDYNTPYPSTFCSAGVSGYRIHLTNIVSLSSTTGVAWYTNISSDTSKDINGAAVGAGVATITYNGSGQPTCKVTPQFWGDVEPTFGDHAVVGNNTDGYIYLFGALGANAPGNNYSDVWVARVPQCSASVEHFDQYTYWNGTGFDSRRLTYPNFNGWAPASVLQETAQGSVHYNYYYNKYIFLFPGPPLSAQIRARTSQNPTGPWSDPVTIYQGNTILYAPTAQPHYDTSGKTLIFDHSVFSPIYLETVKITFN